MLIVNISLILKVIKFQVGLKKFRQNLLTKLGSYFYVVNEWEKVRLRKTKLSLLHCRFTPVFSGFRQEIQCSLKCWLTFAAVVSSNYSYKLNVKWGLAKLPLSCMCASVSFLLKGAFALISVMIIKYSNII